MFSSGTSPSVLALSPGTSEVGVTLSVAKVKVEIISKNANTNTINLVFFFNIKNPPI